ncbi:MAG: PTS sugar transporter subunit IIB [Bacilli bacterium]
MKTIIVACGTGIATSTIIYEKIKDLVRVHGIEANIIQCTIADIDGYADRADIIVTAMKLPSNKYDKPVVTAFSFLTGIGQEVTEQQIVEHLKS